MTERSETPASRKTGASKRNGESREAEGVRGGESPTPRTITDAVLELLDRNGGSATFAEVDHYLDACGIDYKGDRWIAPGDLVDYNIYCWGGVSQEYQNALTTLTLSGKITAHATSLLVYLYDGTALPLPLAKRLHKYDEPHWIPAVIEVTG